MTNQLTQADDTWERRLADLLIDNGYRTTHEEALKFAHEECWQSYKDDGYSPDDAIDEDMSYD